MPKVKHLLAEITRRGGKRYNSLSAKKLVNWLLAHPPISDCYSPGNSSTDSGESDGESDEEGAHSRAVSPAKRQKARMNKKRRPRPRLWRQERLVLCCPGTGWIRLINACATSKEAFLHRDGKVNSRLSLEDGVGCENL
jgi:hypothetical protein